MTFGRDLTDLESISVVSTMPMVKASLRLGQLNLGWIQLAMGTGICVKPFVNICIKIWGIAKIRGRNVL